MALLNPIDLIGGRVLIYIREVIPSKELKNDLPNDTEGMFTELNLRNTKWLLFWCFHPPSLSDNFFSNHIKNDLDKLIQKYTYYKCSNPSCVNLVITNSTLSFQYTVTIASGLFDFYEMVITVLKTEFWKLVPKKVIYRDYKNLNWDEFKKEFEEKINENSNLIGEHDFFE